MVDLEHLWDDPVDVRDLPLTADISRSQMNILRARESVFGVNNTTPWCSANNPFIWTGNVDDLLEE